MKDACEKAKQKIKSWRMSVPHGWLTKEKNKKRKTWRIAVPHGWLTKEKTEHGKERLGKWRNKYRSINGHAVAEPGI